MRSARLSIGGLMGAVGLIAAGFAALGHPSQLWSVALLCLEYLILLSTLLGIILLREEERVSCIGFAVFGWGYVLLSFGGVVSPAAGRYYFLGYPGTQEGAPILTPGELTHRFLDAIDSRKPTFTKSVGESVEVEWNGSYYPSKITEIKGDQFKIHYDSDPRGTFDEWVTAARARGMLSPHYYPIGHSLAALLSGLVGALIARLLRTYARRGYGDVAPSD